MRSLKLFVSAFLAGIFISIGATAFLSVENKVIGATLFSVGLFGICTNCLALYTGKVCYCLENKKNLHDLPVIWFGNFTGTVLSSYLVRLTRIATISEKARQMCLVKMNDSFLSIFVLAFFCNFLIYLAVDGYKNNPHQLGKYLSLLFGVVIFIVCSFEHCVANMFYLSVSNMWNKKTVLLIFINTIGNSVGGISIHFLKKFIGDIYEIKKNDS